MTDCIHCENPAEVCRGCYERARQEAYDWAGERVGLRHASVIHLHRQVADLSERTVLAEHGRDQLRAQLARLREAAKAITDACAAVLPMTHLGDNDLCYPRIGLVRALAKALEECIPTPPPSA